MTWLVPVFVVLLLCCEVVLGKVRLRLVERKKQGKHILEGQRTGKQMNHHHLANGEGHTGSKPVLQVQQGSNDGQKGVLPPLVPELHTVSQNFRNFAVCAVVKDEDRYIHEWVEYHLLLGFNSIHIFDNSNNGSAKIAYLPQQFGTAVKVNHAPGDGKQLKIYNLFVEHIARVSVDPMWVAFIDVDEFIVLRGHSTIQSFLSEVAPSGGAVALNRVQFGSNGNIQYEPAPVLGRFTARKVLAEKVLKSIVYIPDVLEVRLNDNVLRDGAYTVNPSGNKIKTNYKVSNHSISIAYINHYYTKSLEEFKTKKLRGHALDIHMNAQYNSSVVSDNVVLTEFIKADAGANSVEDTFAWDFYRKKKAAERSHV